MRLTLHVINLALLCVLCFACAAGGPNVVRSRSGLKLDAPLPFFKVLWAVIESRTTDAPHVDARLTINGKPADCYGHMKIADDFQLMTMTCASDNPYKVDYWMLNGELVADVTGGEDMRRVSDVWVEEAKAIWAAQSESQAKPLQSGTGVGATE